MNMIVRLSDEKDVDGLYELAMNAGTGMTTVPNSREAIEERVAASKAAVLGTGPAGPKDIFFFVLELDGEVAGMASIFPSLGADRPFYSYRISQVAAAAPELGIQASSELLYLCNDFHGYDEIGTLLVSEKARGTGAGRLLSLCRFLFMKAIEARLSGKVMAEIRGQFDDDGESHFWDAVASKFFHMSFQEADVRSAHDFRFIADLMPKFPIYTELLADEAREVIGKPHPHSAPAMNMLQNEGFRYTNCVDIFDAGPSVEAPLNDISTVKNRVAATVRVQSNIPTEGRNRHIVAVPDQLRFRATLLHRGPRDGSLFLTPEEAETLGVQSGDKVVTSAIRSRKG
ncbi:arginine N-succinyltransferase [Parvularcula sp. ZS-1/3]|uniref:Arginine N-succinyltransferase n=2 Tax=Parvularcula mediterranea TaxID=2732508 RepID=A0A7Y3W5P2_9PROT|nr:arginine N-succinyltransferase [Parvularcula mediterranea]